jgi:thiamine-phosphate pyrophosphorylase
MKIILLTPETDIQQETEIINTLFNGGLEKLHLRKRKYATIDYKKYFEKIDSKFHNRIVLHGGGFNLLEELNAGGLHLNSAQRNDAAVWKSIAGVPHSKLSTSYHSWEEIEKNRTEYGYVFISPVFDSISKTSYQAGVDLFGIIMLRKQFMEQNRHLPELYALGGVDVPHISLLKPFNFDGAAVFGAIWKSGNPINSFRSLHKIASEQ